MEGGAFVWRAQRRRKRRPRTRDQGTLRVPAARYRPRPRLCRRAWRHFRAIRHGFGSILHDAAVNENSALFLDIDGTLLDLARTPDAVVVPAELHAALDTAARANCAARWPLSAAARWPPSTGCSRRSSRPPSAAMAREMRGADGTRAGAGAAAVRIRCAACFRKLAEDHPGVLLEDKIYALALHYRLAPEARPVLMAAMEKHARAVRGGESRHPAWQGGDRGPAGRRRQGRRRARAGRARSLSPAAASCSAATTPPTWTCFASCPNWAGAAFRWAGIFPASSMSSPIAPRGAAMAGAAGRSRAWRHDALTRPLDLAVIGNGRIAALVDTRAPAGVVVLSPLRQRSGVLPPDRGRRGKRLLRCACWTGRVASRVALCAQHRHRRHPADGGRRRPGAHHRFRAALPQFRPHAAPAATDAHHRAGGGPAAHHHPGAAHPASTASR